jgi:hypothetical protein
MHTCLFSPPFLIKLIGPWLHVGYFFLGGYIGQRWVRLEKELVMDINEIRADKGLPPMVATNAWIKYENPE